LPGDLLIAAAPGDWRAALLENGVPVELYVERGDRSEVGSIHLGRVRRLVPALGAALVDIGGDRPAFLPATEVLPRGRRLDEGERVIVQVRREAQGGKPARLTTGMTLRGIYVELQVGRPGLVGGEMLPPEERPQLMDAPSLALPSPGLTRGLRESEGWGLRLRESAPVGVLVSEAEGQLRRWRDIHDRASRLEPPARLYPMATFAAALAGALAAAPSRIAVDDFAAVPELLAAFSGTPVERLSETDWPVDLDGVFSEALSETIVLSGGGSVHFETTRAGVLIDVDSGTPETGSPERTSLAVNLAAAKAIGRQIRLRNLGGGIIVDFIGLEDRRMRERIRDTLSEALVADPARSQILGWTRLGHLELVRPRRGRPLAEALLESRPGGALVKTAVAVAHDALRALRREVRAQPGRKWRLTVAPDVAAALAGPAANALRTLDDRLGRKVVIEPDPVLERDRFLIAWTGHRG
jgi:Rne/Rng family ribonuclease